ncbi:precorrin-6Y C5,15-methyltransferase (decarboxylating) subunit CbiT [Pyrobaculum neutrophilum]|uniref:Probable cobalt-precorrin-6B C(15)-methyltransferase (decarboxylating) n=1 Tax=Pyrobaculum neutrophilum (strain DSM 2338 / JCM 9278 / NBRC 100436 / V24Sta) TaxID=444157 RepID=B1YBB9_PYRNV|nr:precorrin-6Y C5,15-methyltransferase (decarboxylating) subunit CbiT [Pyrobaculum neutrophilum]ACB39250.1 precorrin-6Y C5,15-methyltransferase (decarboxylating), CbiT subunit [Pyrobaculum neutrophilum V24Sta]
MRPAPGIPDEEFIREEGIPMTKAEVRAVVVSKLKVGPGDRMLDVGCGTGSVAVEAALMGAWVYAMDKNPRAVELTARNAAKFGVADRVKAEVEEAPRDFAKAGGPFDAVFIGGGGRDIADVVKAALSLVKPGGRLVVDVATLETLSRLVPLLEEVRHEVVLVQIARGRRVGGYTLLSPLNPVYVVTIWP